MAAKKSSIISSSPKMDSGTSMSIRKIENGFIVNHSGSKGKGRNQQFFNKEYFSPTNPMKLGGKK